MNTDRSTFEPPSWLAGPHAQTMAGVALRSRRGVRTRRERLDTPDGDFIDIDWFSAAPSEGPEPETGDSPLVLMLHGLEGSTRSPYMAVLARELSAQGLSCVGMNFRSCSGELNRGPRLYHAGEFGDVVWVLERLAARDPGRPLMAVGFSIGGNMLMRWLGEAGERARELLCAAAVVSVPFDIEAGASFMESSASRLYLRRLLPSLRVKVAAKRELLASRIDVERALAARSFYEFDEVATAPLHGFADAHDYYARSSSGPWVHGVRVPTLIVHALDDPFLPANAIPRDAIASNAHLSAVLSAHGGHLGFVHGHAWAPRFFAEECVADFLRARFESATTRAASRRSRL